MVADTPVQKMCLERVADERAGFVFDALNDVKGREAVILPIEASSGLVRVRGDSSAPIPEPSGAVLFALGTLEVSPALRRSRRG